MKPPHYPLGQLLREVQEHVTTQDQINAGGSAGRRRVAVLSQVEVSEAHELAELGKLGPYKESDSAEDV